MKKVKTFEKYLVENGLLFEINRKVLHPLGLALVIDVDPENRKWLRFSGLFTAEGDPEGFLYPEETFKENQRIYKTFLDKEGQERLDTREKRLGFLVQGDPGFNPVINFSKCKDCGKPIKSKLTGDGGTITFPRDIVCDECWKDPMYDGCRKEELKDRKENGEG